MTSYRRLLAVAVTALAVSLGAPARAQDLTFSIPLPLTGPLAFTGHAEQLGRWDARVRTVPYSAMNVVRVQARALISTQITFSADETITAGAVAIGDAEAWTVAPMGNMLFIKPIEVRQATNMQVVTQRKDGTFRSYQFELIARPAASIAPGQVASLDGTVPLPDVQTPFAIQFVYPEDAREAAIAKRAAAAAVQSEKLAETRLSVDYFYGPRNWRYAAQGSIAIEPAEVSDNGRLTAMRFPGSAALPTIYTVAADGQETIVPYTLRADVAVVSTTAKEFRLRLGGEVTRIFNLGYDPRGMNPGTGTTSPEIVRSVRGAN